MAGTYTNSANVAIELPSDVPAAITAVIATDIAAASELVEAEVGPCFALAYNSGADKFPGIADSPATPAIVEMAARYYAASLQWGRIGETVDEGEISQGVRYFKMAQERLKGIRNGKYQVLVSGADLRSSNAEAIQDDSYDDTDENVFTEESLNGHLY